MAKLQNVQKIKRCLLVATVWQAIVLIIALIIQITNRQPLSLEYMTNWDGGWYKAILNGAYSNPTSPATAFYPLLPLIVKILQIITFNTIPLPIIILFINIIFLAIAIFFLHEIALIFLKKEKSANLAVLLFLTFPTAFFMGQFYTEVLFCALSFAAYFFALNKQWPKMGVMLAILTATRLPSILIILLCGLEYLNKHQWKIKEAFNKNLAWFLLAPIGFLFYGLYLLSARGNFFSMMEAYSLTNDWVYHRFDPIFIRTIFKEAIIVFTNPFLAKRLNWGNYIVNHLMPFLSLALLAIASVYAIKKFKSKGHVLGITGLISIIFYTLNGNIVSVHRYTLPSFVIFISLASFISTQLSNKLQKLAIASWLILGITTNLILFYLFTNLKFIG
ncbi:MAG: hypothetical protein ACOX0Z_00805 [Candidatus Nanosyncoccaceae bacterium]|jgi:Gpi18-like mannosyltransferase